MFLISILILALVSCSVKGEAAVGTGRHHISHLGPNGAQASLSSGSGHPGSGSGGSSGPDTPADADQNPDQGGAGSSPDQLLGLNFHPHSGDSSPKAEASLSHHKLGLKANGLNAPEGSNAQSNQHPGASGNAAAPQGDSSPACEFGTCAVNGENNAKPNQQGMGQAAPGQHALAGQHPSQMNSGNQAPGQQALEGQHPAAKHLAALAGQHPSQMDSGNQAPGQNKGNTFGQQSFPGSVPGGQQVLGQSLPQLANGQVSGLESGNPGLKLRAFPENQAAGQGAFPPAQNGFQGGPQGNQFGGQQGFGAPGQQAGFPNQNSFQGGPQQNQFGGPQGFGNGAPGQQAGFPNQNSFQGGPQGNQFGDQQGFPGAGGQQAMYPGQNSFQGNLQANPQQGFQGGFPSQQGYPAGQSAQGPLQPYPMAYRGGNQQPLVGVNSNGFDPRAQGVAPGFAGGSAGPVQGRMAPGYAGGSNGNVRGHLAHPPIYGAWI